jgi:hypothetical protein
MLNGMVQLLNNLRKDILMMKYLKKKEAKLL